MKTTEIMKDENPGRYGFILGKYIILCQVESDEYTLHIIKARNGNRPAYKAKVLYEGNVEDFCMEYDGNIGYGQMDVEIAFRTFIETKILKP